MGLIAPSEVNRIYVLRDQSTYPSQGIYPNTFAYKVPMEDIITANGQRFPDHLNSQKYFNVGSVVLSTEELSQKEMSYLDFFTQRASATEALIVSEGFTKGMRKPFFAATEGRASLTTSIYNNEFCLDGMILSETFVDPDYIANDFIISNADIDVFTEYQSRSFTLLPDFEVILGATFETFLNSCK